MRPRPADRRPPTAPEADPRRTAATGRRDLRLYLTGQVVSSLGSSFTAFGLPLLVFELTGSAWNLALTTLSTFLPYVLFGLVVGAWVDRVDRLRALAGSNAIRGVVIGMIPGLWLVHDLNALWLYGIAFTNTSLGLVSRAVEGTAVPALTGRSNLAAVNGRLQGCYAVASVFGPVIAGALVGGGMPVSWVFGFDSASFFVSTFALRMIRTPFNGRRRHTGATVRADIRAGLRLVMGHPVLRSIAMLSVFFNILSGTIWSQIVYFAHVHLAADGTQVSLLFAADGVGIGAVTFAAGRITRRLSFRSVILGMPTVWGCLIFAMSRSSSFWPSCILWAAAAGLPVLFAIRTLTLRQSIVPEEYLGRVQSVAMVVAGAGQPIGALGGAWLIQRTDQVADVYAGIALAVVVSTLAFWAGPLGKPDRVLVPDVTVEGCRSEA
ncbi:MFS transporter [Kitasatospora sp. MAP5-34]|uniref:MFS transporter n=1 Tax=Kitasatospora sp. MAP5-34 TaxID=3035102 RepID=UPI00247663EA|nr:MFS transporter [Kitasatospora sp. MAP5-34]MDH6578632.1 MFS family permease [Kitasatospora sp. MAP5-34]